MAVFAIMIKKPAVPPPYTPPEGDDVEFTFGESYIPPANDEVDIIFPE